MAKFNKISKIKVLRRALESENLPNNCEIIDINDFEIPQGTSICMFGGNITDRPERGNGNAKIIESHIPKIAREKINLYSFGYESEPIKSEGYLSKEYDQEARTLYKRSFEPILFDPKGNMKSPKGIEEAFSRLIFSAHCGGCNFVNIIIDGFYDTLREKFTDKQAEMFINKIQYFAYAPNEMPAHNVNALLIAPYVDPSYSWAKALLFAEPQNIDVDYPRGIIKKITKGQSTNQVAKIFNSTFNDSRAIMFKIGHTVCMIPGQMNKNINTGDHSIAMIGKYKKAEVTTDLDETIKLVCNASSLFIKGFASSKPIDAKSLFSSISGDLANNPPNSESQPQ